MSGLLLNQNFAKSALASGITNVATSLALTAADGAKFPATGDFMCVIWDSGFSSPVSDANRELVKATARSTDTLTIVRAQEGTANKAWNANDNIAHVITAGKLNEVETAIGQHAAGNLLQNTSWAHWDGVAANAPAGWTIAGAGAVVTVANGTYGYRKMTLTAGGGAPATLTQTLSADVPKISSDYGLAAFAYVSAGGTGSLSLGAYSIAVTNTTVALKQGSGSVAAWNFVITIDAGKAITVELPTVTLGKALPYPMYGLKEMTGHQDLGHPQRGVYRGALTDGASMTINLAGLVQSGVDAVLGLKCYWQSISSSKGGILKTVQYRASGGTFQGPSSFVLGAQSATTDSAGYVCVFASTNIVTIKNRVGETIRIAVDYIWG